MVPESLLLASVVLWLGLTTVGAALLAHTRAHRPTETQTESAPDEQWRYEVSQFDDD
jgi:hypothetical protein